MLLMTCSSSYYNVFSIHKYIYALETLTHINTPFKLLLYTLQHINIFLQIRYMKKLEMDFFYIQMFLYSYICRSLQTSVIWKLGIILDYVLIDLWYNAALC